MSLQHARRAGVRTARSPRATATVGDPMPTDAPNQHHLMPAGDRFLARLARMLHEAGTPAPLPVAISDNDT